LQVLGHADFRNLFLGQAASAAGDRIVLAFSLALLVRHTWTLRRLERLRV
jgi:hypothetical protein